MFVQQFMSQTGCSSAQKQNSESGLLPHLYSFETFSFMFQVIEAVIAVTVIAELSICKTVTVAIGRQTKNPTI